MSAANGRPGYGAPEPLRIVFSFPRGRGHLAPMLPLASAASAALGAISEDPTALGKSLIFVGLAEGVCLYGLIISFMIIGRLG